MQIEGINLSGDYFHHEPEIFIYIAKRITRECLPRLRLTLDEQLDNIHASFSKNLKKREKEIKKSLQLPEVFNQQTLREIIKEKAITDALEALKEFDHSTFDILTNPKDEHEKRLFEKALDEGIEAGISPTVDLARVVEQFETLSFNTQIKGVTMRAETNGDEIFLAKDLKQEDHAKVSSVIQLVSVIIELVGLIGSIIGIPLPNATGETIKKVTELLAGLPDELLKSLMDIAQAFSSNEATSLHKSEAVVNIITTLAVSRSTAIELLQAFLNNVPRYEYVIAIAKYMAFLSATFLTGGAVLLAKVILIIFKATKFILKFVNIEIISKIQQKMKGIDDLNVGAMNVIFTF